MMRAKLLSLAALLFSMRHDERGHLDPNPPPKLVPSCLVIGPVPGMGNCVSAGTPVVGF